MAEPELTRKAIDPFSRDVLEFAAVVELLHSYLSGPISEPVLEQVEPHTNLDLIRRNLELARETREYLRESPRPSLAALDRRVRRQFLALRPSSRTAVL
ncbi:MAG: hypothetical protein LAO04_19645 [Acidobacteriia bacterium]|nr:hypothetical protein [Terriglobia bacterium]